MHNRGITTERTPALTVLAARIRGEAYVITWTPNVPRSHVMQTLGRWAANPELSLTWPDATKMAASVYEGAK